MPLTFLPDTGVHELTRLETYANGDERWGCAECGHERIINFDPAVHKNKLVHPGDFSVKHCMGASCAPELDAAVVLHLGSHNTTEMDELPAAPRVYSGCGIKWKKDT